MDTEIGWLSSEAFVQLPLGEPPKECGSRPYCACEHGYNCNISKTEQRDNHLLAIDADTGEVTSRLRLSKYRKLSSWQRSLT